MSADSKKRTATLSRKDIKERQTYDFTTSSFYFLFPLKRSVEYNLVYYGVEVASSTNDLAFTLPIPHDNELQVVTAERQTCGRGQGGTSWESEEGKNLLFSIVCRADFIKPDEQFMLLQAAALAVRHVLGKLTKKVAIKWPNDIYVNDRKASGTLIQCDMEEGKIRRVIIGVGINVNQEKFLSDAPDPISMIEAVGHPLDRKAILHSVAERFAIELESLRDNPEYIRGRYTLHMWRDKGMHPYRDAEGEFRAEFVRVEDDGHLVLRDESGRERTYAFKEVKFLPE